MPYQIPVIRLLCFLAFSLSGYLLYGSLTGERIPGCGMQSGCHSVLVSRWAYVLGLPVSLPAMVLYAAVFGATYIRAERAWKFLEISAGILVGAAVYFVLLQVAVIGAICPFCMSAHACGFLAGLLLIRKIASSPAASGNPPRNGPRQNPSMAARLRSGPFVLGFAAVGLLAIAQSVWAPTTFRVSSSEGIVLRDGDRVLQLHGGAIRIPLREVPLLGSPKAPFVVVHLFDYTCPHCRRFHPVLREVMKSLSNQVAVASLVVPLQKECNPVVRVTQHTNACELAFAALAVWRAAPGKFEEFDHWLFSTAQPPLPEAAKAKGRELAGTNAFDQVFGDAWSKNHLTSNSDLYATNYYKVRISVLPELMIGTNMISGVVPAADYLERLIRTQAGLPVAPGDAR
jgi:uncharacterized membrane protein/protein-disulfide isomerase